MNGRVVTGNTRLNTLGAIIARINAAGAGVLARHNSVSDPLTFTPVPPDARV